MAAPVVTFHSPAHYLDLERQSQSKHELVNGQIYAMAGASSAHLQIVANLMFSLGTALRGSSCRSWANDLRVKVPATEMYTYPDVTVFCGEPIFDDERQDTLTNPLVIFEVLSPSTASYDRGAKFANYRKIESLQAYVLVEQDWVTVDHYLQKDAQWVLTSYEEITDTLQLPTLNTSLPLSEIYERLTLPNGPSYQGQQRTAS